MVLNRSSTLSLCWAVFSTRYLITECLVKTGTRFLWSNWFIFGFHVREITGRDKDTRIKRWTKWQSASVCSERSGVNQKEHGREGTDRKHPPPCTLRLLYNPLRTLTLSVRSHVMTPSTLRNWTRPPAQMDFLFRTTVWVCSSVVSPDFSAWTATNKDSVCGSRGREGGGVFLWRTGRFIRVIYLFRRPQLL